MTDASAGDAEGRKHWRKHKRQDTGLMLFETARDSLDDLQRCKPILFELTRLYNPVVDGPLVDRTTYARILDCVESGQVEEARRLLEARLALYAPGDDGKADPDRYRGGAGPFHI